MTCREASNLLARFFDGELDAHQMRAVALHSTRCGTCETALRQLERLPRDAARRIRSKLALLADDPFRGRPGADIRLLWGQDDPPLYRLRVGDYRVLYFVQEDEIRVTEVLHRSQAYRGID